MKAKRQSKNSKNMLRLTLVLSNSQKKTRSLLAKIRRILLASQHNLNFSHQRKQSVHISVSDLVLTPRLNAYLWKNRPQKCLLALSHPSSFTKRSLITLLTSYSFNVIVKWNTISQLLALVKHESVNPAPSPVPRSWNCHPRRAEASRSNANCL